MANTPKEGNKNTSKMQGASCPVKVPIGKRNGVPIGRRGYQSKKS